MTHFGAKGVAFQWLTGKALQMTPEEYLQQFVGHLTQELEPIVKVKEVTTNTALLGHFAEAALRRLIRRIAHPMQVSTGAILDYPMPAKLRQLDMILWAPFPAPAIFEVEGFALVPRSSAFGVLELKLSNYPTGVTELEKFVQTAPTLVGNHPTRWNDDTTNAVKGVIGVIDRKISKRLAKLLAAKKVCAIFERQGAEVVLRHNDVIELVNFIHFVGWRYRVRAAQPGFLTLATATHAV
jgi:hypothetical protein